MEKKTAIIKYNIGLTAVVRVCSSLYVKALPYGMLVRSCAVWARSKSGLVSVPCCSEINVFCL